jgi:selenocysteine-specific elongation factor
LTDLGGRLYPEAHVEAVERRILDLVAGYHRAHPAEAGLSLETLRHSVPEPAPVADAVLRRLEDRGAVRARDGVVSLPSFQPAFEGGDETLSGLVDRIAAAGLEPPTLAELASTSGIANLGPLLRRAVEIGAIVAVERDRYYAAAALARFRETLAELGRAGPITPGAVRDRLGLSRKYSIPLLEWADRQGITRRQGDVRVLVRSDR